MVDGQNKRKRVTPMPRARPKNVHARPLKPPQQQPVNTCVEMIALRRRRQVENDISRQIEKNRFDQILLALGASH
jgi:hypothetical protein